MGEREVWMGGGGGVNEGEKVNEELRGGGEER